MKKLLIHLGYPKTATTTIQNRFFSKHPKINYLGRPFLNEEISKAMYIISDYDDLIFDHYLDFLVGVFDKNLQENKINILSSEHHTHKFTLILGGAAERNLGLIAKRLALILKQIEDIEIQFLFTLRNPISMFESYYIQKYNDFKKTDLNSFEKFYNYSIANLDHGFMLSLDYNCVISYYEKLFGKQNINILIFEEFLSDKNNYFSKLSKITAIEKNEIFEFIGGGKENISNKDRFGRKFKYSVREKSYFYKTLKMIYLKTNFKHPIFLRLKDLLLYLFSEKTEAIKLTDQQKQEIIEIFSNSNYELSNKYNLSLERFGYLEKKL